MSGVILINDVLMFCFIPAPKSKSLTTVTSQRQILLIRGQQVRH